MGRPRSFVNRTVRPLQFSSQDIEAGRRGSTPLNAQVRANNPELVKIFLDHTPLGPAGQPKDIVGPAIFLASDLSAYVTGSIVMADGGYLTI